jgi:hypothetical protein
MVGNTPSHRPRTLPPHRRAMVAITPAPHRLTRRAASGQGEIQGGIRGCLLHCIALTPHRTVRPIGFPQVQRLLVPRRLSQTLPSRRQWRVRGCRPALRRRTRGSLKVLAAGGQGGRHCLQLRVRAQDRNPLRTYLIPNNGQLVGGARLRLHLIRPNMAVMTVSPAPHRFVLGPRLLLPITLLSPHRQVHSQGWVRG